MSLDAIQNDSYQQLLVDLGVAAPVVGEKTFKLDVPFKVRDEAGNEQTYQVWDVLKRADDTYWSPLDGERNNLQDITAYMIYVQKTDVWVTMAEWFALDYI
ncbi:hypothetical protein [Weissella ceti]|uniref:hypothetical protein n=1 Tax=Weissella ceti TaxID=759620 RepID=UPI001BCF908E|nr:hypothetical protein [Weissella ceti]QVK11724.1 hypothetical protein KHQ31_05730 [Weissella ceti]